MKPAIIQVDTLIPQHGDYWKLKSFRVAQLAYDMTARFVARYVDRFSRTRDQLVQAARSCRGGAALSEPVFLERAVFS